MQAAVPAAAADVSAGMVRVGARPSATGSPDAGKAVASAASAAPPAVDQKAFETQCIELLRGSQLRRAVEHCGRFTQVPELAGKAHAALAALYATRSFYDRKASVFHAQQSAEAGDERGKFMAALHMLSGHSEQPFDLDQVRAWLKEAAAGRVPHASTILARLKDSEACRSAADAFQLFGSPVFCLFRPELAALMEEHGMDFDGFEAGAWTDRWTPGEVLAGADHAQAEYDRDPRDELLRLARFGYRFDKAAAAPRLPVLSDALVGKYGRPAAGTLPLPPGAMALWRTAGGVEIRLQHAADGSVSIDYTQPERLGSRQAHQVREGELARMARVRLDQAAL